MHNSIGEFREAALPAVSIDENPRTPVNAVRRRTTALTAGREANTEMYFTGTAFRSEEILECHLEALFDCDVSLSAIVFVHGPSARPDPVKRSFSSVGR